MKFAGCCCLRCRPAQLGAWSACHVKCPARKRCRVRTRRPGALSSHFVHAGMAARQDHAFELAVGGVVRGSIRCSHRGVDFAVSLGLARGRQSAGVTAAEIEDEDLSVLHGGGPSKGWRIKGANSGTPLRWAAAICWGRDVMAAGGAATTPALGRRHQGGQAGVQRHVHHGLVLGGAVVQFHGGVSPPASHGPSDNRAECGHYSPAADGAAFPCPEVGGLRIDLITADALRGGRRRCARWPCRATARRR